MSLRAAKFGLASSGTQWDSGVDVVIEGEIGTTVSCPWRAAAAISMEPSLWKTAVKLRPTSLMAFAIHTISESRR